MVVRPIADSDSDICRQVLRALVAAGCDACVVAVDGEVGPDDSRPRGLPVVLALRDAGPAVAARLSAGTLRPLPSAAVLLDWSGAGATRELPVPVLALSGSSLPPAAGAGVTARCGLTLRTAAVPICLSLPFV